MDKQEFNILVQNTIKQGHALIYERFTIKEFEDFQDKLIQISNAGYKICKDEVQLKTCYIIANKKVEEYRLTLLEQSVSSYRKLSYGVVSNENTEEMIRLRYILEMTSLLPMLELKNCII